MKRCEKFIVASYINRKHLVHHLEALSMIKKKSAFVVLYFEAQKLQNLLFINSLLQSCPKFQSFSLILVNKSKV